VIVLDASAAVELLLVRDAASVVDRFSDPDVTVHAPSLLGVEVAAALRGLVPSAHDPRAGIDRADRPDVRRPQSS
jgi:predicted nucleic acid-binding protein